MSEWSGFQPSSLLSCSLYLSIRHQQFFCHFPLHPGRGGEKKNQFILRSHVHVQHLQTQSVTERQPYRTANITCCLKPIFIASVFLSLNDFDASLLHSKIEVCSLFVSAPLVSSWYLQLHWLFLLLSAYCHVQKPRKHHKWRESGASLCCLPPLCRSKHWFSAQIASY